MESPASRTGGARKRSWLHRTVLLLACAGALVIGVVLATLLFGHTRGEEFCPTKFTRRSFSYFQIPLVGLQVSSITRDDRTSDLETDLTQNGLVPQVTPGEPEWDLVYAMHSGVLTLRGDAAYLCRYLDARDSQGELYWKAWTEKHPDLAKVLWPAVAHTARRQLYFFVPELFELADQATDPTRLDGELRAALARSYARFAEIQQRLGYSQRAADLLDQALAYAPDDPGLKRHRAEFAPQPGHAPTTSGP